MQTETRLEHGHKSVPKVVTPSKENTHNTTTNTPNEVDNDDSVMDLEETDDVLVDDLPEVVEQVLPKDVGEINVRGHLRFDEEMPPDDETQMNTMFNALMYHMSHDYYKQNEVEMDVKEGSISKDVIEFDTFSANLDVQTYHMTKIVQDAEYEFHNMSKTWLVPFDEEKPSLDALEWVFQELVAVNDTVVVVKIVSLQSILKFGVSEHRKNCNELFDKVEKIKNKVNGLVMKLILEVKIGAVNYMINKSIRDFDPIALVMGTKGIKKSKLTSFLKIDDQSTTKQFVERCRIPVIVVNPFYEMKPHSLNNTESSIRERITSYPSVYDPENAVHTMEMERMMSSESSTNNSVSGMGMGLTPVSSRTSRFLRIGKSLSRGGSPSPSSPMTSASTSSLSPTISTSKTRGTSSTRSPPTTTTLHSSMSNDLKSVKSMDSLGDALSPSISNSSFRRTLSPFRFFKRQ